MSFSFRFVSVEEPSTAAIVEESVAVIPPTTEREGDCVSVRATASPQSEAMTRRRRGKGLHKKAKSSAQRTRESSLKVTNLIRDTYLTLPEGYRKTGPECSKFIMMTQISKFIKRVTVAVSQDS